MEATKHFNTDVQTAPELATTIDRWLVARGQYQKHASDETQHAYNATLFDLGAVWVSRSCRNARSLRVVLARPHRAGDG